jgi:hypothetical protein
MLTWGMRTELAAPAGEPPRLLVDLDAEHTRTERMRSAGRSVTFSVA